MIIINIILHLLASIAVFYNTYKYYKTKEVKPIWFYALSFAAVCAICLGFINTLK